MSSLIQFIDQIARMTYDGEELEDGIEFDMSGDDAAGALSCLIREARELQGSGEQQTIDGIVTWRRSSVMDAYRALAGYKFWMFGYHAARWVTLNKLLPSELREGSPFTKLVKLADDLVQRALINPAELKAEIERAHKIVEMARDQYYRDGECEIDEQYDDAVLDSLSEGEDNGTYVKAWVWVDFAGTEFDKDAEDHP